MLNVPNRIALLAAAAGTAWTVKALAITAADASVQPVEGVLFLGGLVAILTAAALFGVHLAGRRHVAVRVAAGLVGAAAGLVVTFAIEGLGKRLVAGAASGSNQGLEVEGGILLAGLVWLAAGLLARRRPGAAALPA